MSFQEHKYLVVRQAISQGLANFCITTAIMGVLVAHTSLINPLC